MPDQQSQSVLDSLATLTRGSSVRLHLESGDVYEATVSKTNLTLPDEDVDEDERDYGVVNYGFWAADSHVEDGPLPKDDLGVVGEWWSDEAVPEFDLTVWDPTDEDVDNRQMLGTLSEVERVETDGGQQTIETDDREDLENVQSVIAAVNKNAAEAVQQSCRLATSRHPMMELGSAHDALLDTYQEVRRALDRVEQTMDQRDPGYGRPTPRTIKSDHAERIKEQYEGPVLNLALMLLEQNRREWLHFNPETNGADEVRRHGLTRNQRQWLNELYEAWGTYEGREDDE